MSHSKLLVIAFTAFCLISLQLHGLAQAEVDKTDGNFSLKDITITDNKSEVFPANGGLNRTESSFFRSPFAIHVITSEDIRRSGATSIQEALRLAPGVQVAKTNSQRWAISTRGFNGQSAKRVLVMIDGRSIYTPLFAGVYWDVQDLLIEDIKRIEVIRGPGATIWGANAVNGVINIITKSAQETQGFLATATAGTSHIGFTEGVRYGGKIKDNGYYRIYAKRQDIDEIEEAGSNLGSGDDWSSLRSGFRFDWSNKSNDYFTLQGDLYEYDQNRKLTIFSDDATEVINVVNQDTAAGGNILFRWSHKHENNSESITQLYYDRTERTSIPLDHTRDTIDFDYQNTWGINARNKLVWGVGYRKFIFKLQDTAYFGFMDDYRNEDRYSTFFQHEIGIIDNELYLTLGAKFENNGFTGFEYQPSVKLAWHPSQSQTLWASIARAVNTPNLSDDSINIITSQNTDTGGFNRTIGNSQIQSEDQIAYEVGYRSRPTNNFSYDISLFYNDYSDMVALLPSYQDGNDVITPGSNYGSGYSIGGELTSTLDVTDKLRLNFTYSFISIEIDADSTRERAEGGTPKHQFNIRAHYNITDNLELDNILYFVDELEAINLKDYTRLDTRLAWRPKPNLELSLVGQNLLEDSHQEFSPTFYTSPTEVGRTIYGKVVWKF